MQAGVCIAVDDVESELIWWWIGTEKSNGAPRGSGGDECDVIFDEIRCTARFYTTKSFLAHIIQFNSTQVKNFFCIDRQKIFRHGPDQRNTSTGAKRWMWTLYNVLIVGKSKGRLRSLQSKLLLSHIRTIAVNHFGRLMWFDTTGMETFWPLIHLHIIFLKQKVSENDHKEH